MMRQNSGFTLIELLVVISIIAVLSSVVLASLTSANSKGRDARRKEDLEELSNALNLYYSDNGSYPTCTNLGYPNACLWSSWPGWSNLVPRQDMSQVPVDPSNTDLLNCDTNPNCHIYRYCPYNNYQNFVLAVNLENSSSMSNNSNCPTGGPNYYWVGN